jgi:hypothetical protein
VQERLPAGTVGLGVEPGLQAPRDQVFPPVRMQLAGAPSRVSLCAAIW